MRSRHRLEPVVRACAGAVSGLPAGRCRRADHRRCHRHGSPRWRARAGGCCRRARGSPSTRAPAQRSADASVTDRDCPRSRDPACRAPVVATRRSGTLVGAYLLGDPPACPLPAPRPRLEVAGDPAGAAQALAAMVDGRAGCAARHRRWRRPATVTPHPAAGTTGRPRSTRHWPPRSARATRPPWRGVRRPASWPRELLASVDPLAVLAELTATGAAGQRRVAVLRRRRGGRLLGRLLALDAS